MFTGNTIILRRDEVSCNDIFCSRGNGVLSHSGNQSYHDLIKKHKIIYQRKSPRPLRQREKKDIVRDVVNTINSMEPPGRFLKAHPSDSDRFIVISDPALVTKKVSQALREKPKIASKLKRQLTQAKRRKLESFQSQVQKSSDNIGDTDKRTALVCKLKSYTAAQIGSRLNTLIEASNQLSTNSDSMGGIHLITSSLNLNKDEEKQNANTSSSAVSSVNKSQIHNQAQNSSDNIRDNRQSTASLNLNKDEEKQNANTSSSAVSSVNKSQIHNQAQDSSDYVGDIHQRTASLNLNKDEENQNANTASSAVSSINKPPLRERVKNSKVDVGDIQQRTAHVNKDEKRLDDTSSSSTNKPQKQVKNFAAGNTHRRSSYFNPNNDEEERGDNYVSSTVSSLNKPKPRNEFKKSELDLGIHRRTAYSNLYKEQEKCNDSSTSCDRSTFSAVSSGNKPHNDVKKSGASLGIQRRAAILMKNKDQEKRGEIYAPSTVSSNHKHQKNQNISLALKRSHPDIASNSSCSSLSSLFPSFIGSFAICNSISKEETESSNQDLSFSQTILLMNQSVNKLSDIGQHDQKEESPFSRESKFFVNRKTDCDGDQLSIDDRLYQGTEISSNC